MSNFEQTKGKDLKNDVTEVNPIKKVKHHHYVSYIGIIGLVVLLLIVILSARHPSPTKNIPSVATITITSQGFVPATVRVPNGMQVIWTNIDSSPHQVAADPYPLNNSISRFNSNIILHPKDSYSYVFEKPGRYTYHDERNPLNKSLQGTIIVSN